MQGSPKGLEGFTAESLRARGGIWVDGLEAFKALGL